MISDIEKLVEEFRLKLEAETELPALENVKAAYIGKKGPLTDSLKNLRNLSPEEKSVVGQAANKAKQQMWDMRYAMWAVIWVVGRDGEFHISNHTSSLRYSFRFTDYIFESDEPDRLEQFRHIINGWCGLSS